MVVNGIAAIVRENWERFGLAPPAPARLQFLKASSGVGSTKIIFLGFADTARFPVVVAKVAQSGAERMRRTHDLLLRLRPELPSSLRRAIPRPLVVTTIGDATVAIESYLPGRRMYRFHARRPSWAQRRGIERDFDLAGSWLIALHQATRSETAVTPERVRGWFAQPLDAFKKRMQPSPAELAALERALAALTDTLGARMPLVWQQGDYWPRNLLVLDDRLGVCDWEWSSSAELPFLDVFLFPLSYSFLLGGDLPNRDALREGLRTAFLARGWFAEVCRGFVAAHMEALALDPALGPSFFHLMLLHMAVRDYLATGCPSRNDLRHRDLLRTAVEEEVATRGWLKDLPRDRTDAG